MKRLFLSVALLNLTTFAAPTPDNWTNADTTNPNFWSVANNWASGVPNSNTVQAVFPATATPPFFVFVDGTFTVNSIRFPLANTKNYSLFNGFINLKANGTDLPTVLVEAGSQVTSTNFNVNNDTTFNIFASASFTSSAVIDAGGFPSNSSVTFTGDGLFNNYGFIVNLNNFTSSLDTFNNFGNILSGQNLFVTSGTFTNFNTIKNFVSLQLTGGDLINDGGTIDGITTISVAESASLLNRNGGVISHVPTFNSNGLVDNSAHITSVGGLNVTGGIFNNNFSGELDHVTTLSVTGGRFNNLLGSSLHDVTEITIDGGTLSNGSVIDINIGDFTITSGTYAVDVRDELDRAFLASDTMHLGGNLHIDLLPGFDTTGEQILIMHSNAFRQGRFATAETSDPLVDVRVLYDPNDVSLVLVPFIPNLSANFHLPIFSSIDLINYRIEREMVKVRNRLCCKCPWNLYGGVIGTEGKLKSRDSFIGFDYSSIGGLIGLDYASCEWGFGALINYEQIKNDGHRFDNDQTIDHLHAAVYATYVPRSLLALGFDGIVGYSHDWLDMSRALLSNEISSRVEADEWDVLFGVEYASHWNRCLMIVPYGTIQYINFRLDHFNEFGTDFFDFTFRERHIDSLRSVFGLRFVGEYSFWGIKRFAPEIDIGWMREYFDNSRFSIASAIAPQLATRLHPGQLNRDFLVLAVDLFAQFNCLGVDVSYDLEWNEQFHNNTFYVGGAVRF